MTVRALLFDLDETLMVEPESVHAALRAACELAEWPGIAADDLRQAVLKKAKELWYAAPTGSYCRTVGISSWEGLHGDFSGEDPNLKALAAWVPAYRQEAWARALADFGIRDAALGSQLDERFRRERAERHVKFPDTDETLARLRPHYKFGLVTNGAPRIQREKIERTGLAPLFDAVVVSGDIGVGKPDVRIFRRALELLEVEPQEAVMIGNNLERDMAGAKAADLPRIWIDREGRETAPEGCLRITSLAALVTVLGDGQIRR
ncbi:MAG TPA: HAD family hydrolase [Planctomycetota bacterium]|nr:HAD family hydrolase [Planctomycetota bacterium]